MSRKVLDSNISDADIDFVMNNIVAQNPQLNAQIEQVRNESNVFLCQVLRIYPYEDKAKVKIINNNESVFCRLSHEVLGGGMCVDYLPKGIEKTDFEEYVGKKYVEPFDDLYGIMIKVRWENLTDENVLLGYVNIHDSNDLKSSNDTGEISIKSGSSILSVDDERINIMTPALFINGLPYNEPELYNYYNKNELDIITNTILEKINVLNKKYYITIDFYQITSDSSKLKINFTTSMFIGIEITVKNMQGDLIKNMPFDLMLNTKYDIKGKFVDISDDFETINDLNMIDNCIQLRTDSNGIANIKFQPTEKGIIHFYTSLDPNQKFTIYIN